MSGSENKVDPRWLEAILDRHNRETSIARILSLSKEDVVKKGDNYVSEITRLVLQCVLGNGDRVTRTIIVKSVPSTENRAKFITESGIFKKEIIMLSEVIPKMNELLREAGDLGDPLGCDIIYYKPYDMLIMQDLKEEGFKMRNRFIGISVEEATVAVEELARFHAVSVAMKQKSLIDVDDFRYEIFDKETEMIQAFQDKSFGHLIQVIEEHWEPEWKPYADALRKFEGKSVELWNKMVKTEGKFNVLNHGDFWLNNMLFKSMPGQEKPLAVRMVDFQITFYGSFAFDWLYFTGTSLQSEVRNENYDELFSTYYEALTRTMKLLNLEPPSFETLKAEVHERALLGLFMAVIMTPIMKTDPEDVIDMEKLFSNMEKMEEIDVSIKPYSSKSLKTSLQVLLPKFKDFGVI